MLSGQSVACLAGTEAARLHAAEAVRGPGCSAADRQRQGGSQGPGATLRRRVGRRHRIRAAADRIGVAVGCHLARATAPGTSWHSRQFLPAWAGIRCWRCRSSSASAADSTGMCLCGGFSSIRRWPAWPVRSRRRPTHRAQWNAYLARIDSSRYRCPSANSGCGFCSRRCRKQPRITCRRSFDCRDPWTLSDCGLSAGDPAAARDPANGAGTARRESVATSRRQRRA